MLYILKYYSKYKVNLKRAIATTYFTWGANSSPPCNFYAKLVEQKYLVGIIGMV